MEKVNISQDIQDYTDMNSENAENLSSSEAKKLYEKYNQNRYNILIYTKEDTAKIRDQIGGRGDILRQSDWKKIKKLIDETVSNGFVENNVDELSGTKFKDEVLLEEGNDTNLDLGEQKINNNSSVIDNKNNKVEKKTSKKDRLSEEEINKIESNISKINSVGDLKKYCKDNSINPKELQRTIGVTDDGIIGNITYKNLKNYIDFSKRVSDFTDDSTLDLSDNNKEKLYSLFEESEGIKRDCYSYISYIAKELGGKFQLLDNFLLYNKIFNSKKNGYNGSLTQFLRIEGAEKADHSGLMKKLKSAPKNSIFLISMNTRGKPPYEHTGFITIEENNKIYFTHGETSDKDGSTGAIKEEITQDGGYFESSTVRKRYKKGYFNLKQII